MYICIFPQKRHLFPPQNFGLSEKEKTWSFVKDFCMDGCPFGAMQ